MSVTTFTVAFPDELVEDAKEAAETIGGFTSMIKKSLRQRVVRSKPKD